MNHEIVQLVTGLLGSVGFSLLFNLRRQYLPYAALGGFLCWGTYLLSEHFGAGTFFASFAAAFVSSLFAEILARVLKAPVTLFLISTLIPLVPGSSLYYAMYSIVAGNPDAARSYASATGLCVLGIASGICAVTAVVFTRKTST